jgi:hypothetical protein
MRRSDLGAQISGKNVDVNIMMGTYTEAEGGIKITLDIEHPEQGSSGADQVVLSLD